MASLDDILTTQKNGVIAINALSQAYLRMQGISTSLTINSNTTISSIKGYLVSVSVVVAGSSAGQIYNAASNATAIPANLLAVVSNTTGVYPLGLNYNAGIYIVPGTNQSLNVTYTPTTG
jgi:hypothetical protein